MLCAISLPRVLIPFHPCRVIRVIRLACSSVIGGRSSIGLHSHPEMTPSVQVLPGEGVVLPSAADNIGVLLRQEVQGIQQKGKRVDVVYVAVEKQ